MGSMVAANGGRIWRAVYFVEVRVTNAFMEGLNSVFSATKRKARGYRSTTHLITMLYFVAGRLRLPQF